MKEYPLCVLSQVPGSLRIQKESGLFSYLPWRRNTSMFKYKEKVASNEDELDSGVAHQFGGGLLRPEVGWATVRRIS